MDSILHLNQSRVKVELRVFMSDRARVKRRVDVPDVPLTVNGQDPSILWLGPDRWLFVSDTWKAGALVSKLEQQLTGVVCSVVDLSSALACYELAHSEFRQILASGSGIDFDKLGAGQCARTCFAQVPLIVVPKHDSKCELYADATFRTYLESRLNHAAP